MADTANQMAVPDPTTVLRQELAMWKNRARVWERQFKALVDELAEERVEHQSTNDHRLTQSLRTQRQADRIWRLRIALADQRDRLRERHRKETRGRRCPKTCGTCGELDRLWKLVDPVQDMQEGA